MDVDENLTDLPELENEDSERYDRIWKAQNIQKLSKTAHQISGYVCLFSTWTISSHTPSMFL